MTAIAPERPEDAADIELLLDRAFGADRNGKTVYRLREGVAPMPELAFTAHDGGRLVASLRFWPVDCGLGEPALLLGPLAVEPALQGRGYGRALMWHGLAVARRLGWQLVILVGDPAYYEPFGFTRGPVSGLWLPGPVEQRRFLGLDLEPGAGARAVGPVLPWRGPYRPSRYQAAIAPPTNSSSTRAAGSSGI